jgi:hypothetical protein
MRLTRPIALAGACLLTMPAVAETSVFYSAGVWQAFSGVANNGVNLCGISESSNGRWWGLKYFQGSDYLTVHIAKNGWHIPAKTQVNVNLQFDSHAPWQAVASGFTIPQGMSGMEFYVKRDAVLKFTDELRYSARVAIAFPDGDEGPWVGELRGSNAAVTALTGCISRLAPANPPVTSDNSTSQPFGNRGSSQPFRAVPQPVPEPAPQVAPVRGGFQNL